MTLKNNNNISMIKNNFFSLNVRSKASGNLCLPGSKSISNRVILLAALCNKKVEIVNYLQSEDTDVMLSVLDVLGVKFQKKTHSEYYQSSKKQVPVLIIEGIGDQFDQMFNQSEKLNFFVGNSGLTIRTILPVLVAIFSQKSESLTIKIDGVERMRQRPIGGLVECLQKIGANITYLEKKGYPPLLIYPRKIEPINEILIDSNDSSQFLTGVLQAAPIFRKFWNGPLLVKAAGLVSSRPYVDLTIKILKQFEIFVEEVEKNVFKIDSKRVISPNKIIVEGDASSASYFLAAGALGKGPIYIEGLGTKSIQGDIKLANILKKMGADVIFDDYRITIKSNKKLSGVKVDCRDIPDAAMVLVPCALYADSPTLLTNIGSWRVKETDRIEAMREGVLRLGGKVRYGKDWIEISPPKKLDSAHIKTFNDHRVAMSFALASFSHPGDETICQRKITFDNPKCVEKTYPDFFDEFSRVCSEAVKVITIDGPTASGKGTIANKVSKILGFRVLDSGCLYRVLALISAECDVGENEELKLSKCAENLNINFSNGKVFIGTREITDKIRDESIGIRASKISVFKSVRKTLLRYQRDFARHPGLVADGRDMGSIVFPNAFLKVFLSADATIRAERRYKQLIQKEIPCKIGDLLQEIKKRDLRDTNREVGSLNLAKDACSVYIDTSSKSIDEVVKVIVDEFSLKSSL